MCFRAWQPCEQQITDGVTTFDSRSDPEPMSRKSLIKWIISIFKAMADGSSNLSVVPGSQLQIQAVQYYSQSVNKSIMYYV